MFDHFLDFDRLFEGGAQIAGYRPLLREVLGLGFM
jgi:hypothetical protein